MVWRSGRFEEETWETEASMRHQYPHLFETAGKNFGDEILFMEGRVVDPSPESVQYRVPVWYSGSALPDTRRV